MTLAERLKQLRRDSGLSQEAVGAQGFVSTPGWIKMENGQRSVSETLIANFVSWLVRDRYIRATAAATLRDELLTLKYLGNRSPFVRQLATAHAHQIPGGKVLLVESTPAKPKRGRPPGNRKALAA